MGDIIRRLFGCRACDVRERELERAHDEIRWLGEQLNRQNVRLVEMVSPGAAARASRAEDPPQSRPVPFRVPAREKAAIPGFEPEDVTPIEVS
jgi:hypothetical protein